MISRKVQKLDSWDLACRFLSFLDTLRPQASQNCGTYSFNAKIRILAEIPIDWTKKNRLYERGYLGNYETEIPILISDLDSVALYAAQVCYVNMPRAL